MFYVYKLTSPSGRAYVGYTGQTAASQGLKKFWVELRKDPEAYAAYMAARRVSLQKTLEQKRAVKCE